MIPLDMDLESPACTSLINHHGLHTVSGPGYFLPVISLYIFTKFLSHANLYSCKIPFAKKLFPMLCFKTSFLIPVDYLPERNNINGRLSDIYTL